MLPELARFSRLARGRDIIRQFGNLAPGHFASGLPTSASWLPGKAPCSGVGRRRCPGHSGRLPPLIHRGKWRLRPGLFLRLGACWFYPRDESVLCLLQGFDGGTGLGDLALQCRNFLSMLSIREDHLFPGLG